MTEGQIGYLIQQTLGNLLSQHVRELPEGGSVFGIAGRPDVVSLVTQVLVSADDPAFQHPTKPIGPFYDQATAEALAKEKGWTVVKDADRGWRRVVPSPQPLEVIEATAIRGLIATGAIVVAGGGGGIPVVRGPEGSLRGVEAVIDKDLAAERLASLVGADTLVLLTGVRKVALDYGTPKQRDLSSVSIADAGRYLAAGQFPAGSMGPKVKAATQFLQNGGREAIVTAPEALAEALAGTEGTRFVR
jgi:carbamate kinase